MINRFAVVLFLTWTNFAAAFDYPSLHSVSGVAPNDTLNVRAKASGSAEIVGTLNHDAKGVEVIRQSENGKWGLVNVGEAAGWTSMRYLSKSPRTPLNTQCFGNEPFWSASVGRETFFEPAGEMPRGYQVVTETKSTNRTDRFGTVAEGPSGMLVATMTVEECSDGMSDRQYGLSVELLIQSTRGWTQHSGCCSVSR